MVSQWLTKCLMIVVEIFVGLWIVRYIQVKQDEGKLSCLSDGDCSVSYDVGIQEKTMLLKDS